MNVVLGNLLDNAIDASAQTEEKKLKLTLKLDKGILLNLRDEGKTIILASHNKEDIEILCDEVYEMDHGNLTALV